MVFLPGSRVRPMLEATQAMPTPTPPSLSTLAMIVAIASMLVGVLATLVMIVMFLAGGANATEAAIRQTKWMMASVVVVQVVSLIGSIALLNAGRSGLACTAALAPVAYAIVLVTILVKIEW